MEKRKVIERILADKERQIEQNKKSIKQQLQDIEKYVENGDWYWMEVSTKMVLKYTQDNEHLKKEIQDMKDITNYLLGQEEN